MHSLMYWFWLHLRCSSRAELAMMEAEMVILLFAVQYWSEVCIKWTISDFPVMFYFTSFIAGI